MLLALCTKRNGLETKVADSGGFEFCASAENFSTVRTRRASQRGS